MFAEKKKIEEQIQSIDLELSRMPAKHLFCTRNGTHFKWYESDGKNNTYIPKKERAYAEQLAAKKYLTLLREDLCNEKNAIDFYLRHHRTGPGMADKLLTDAPAYAELLASYFRPDSLELLEWNNAPYERSELHTENLIHKTTTGVYVRSKSEATIAMFLAWKKVPFHYEELLQIGGVSFYPDFTIKHPTTGKIIYWEHFGMMDVPDYMRNAFAKMQVYAANGIVLGENLIATFETKQSPLDYEMVRRMVDYYFE